MPASPDRILNALVRHQLYLERVKAGQYAEFAKAQQKLDRRLKEALYATPYKTLDALTKVELQKLAAKLRKIQLETYNAYTQTLLENLYAYMQVDAGLSLRLHASLKVADEASEVERIPLLGASDASEAAEHDEDAEKRLYPLGWFTGDFARLWSAVLNAPLPANGVLLPSFVAMLSASSVAAVDNLIRKAYANRTSLDDLIAYIIGTPALRFTDGQSARTLRNANAVISTALQHVSAVVQNGAASLFYRRYRWVSVIDSRTSDICRSRNGLVFEYGKGPLPPAHVRCRSTTVPVTVEDTSAVPAVAEIRNMPDDVLADIFGRDKVDGVKSGKIKEELFARTGFYRPLSVKGFADKLRYLLMS